MKTMKKTLLGLATAALALVSVGARAGVAITEVAPWSSGNSPVGADWFELTNTGSTSLSIAGWSMDDSSATPFTAMLDGIGSIAAGESVIFVEGSASAAAAFVSTWFGASAPAGFRIGTYSGSGVGLSTSGDGVNVFDAAGVAQAGVSFGSSPTGPYATFDNAAGTNGPISQLSVVGVNGAFKALADNAEIGSPGAIAAVPEPATTALLLAGLGVVGAATRRTGRGRARG